jgi:hypothetical protein
MNIFNNEVEKEFEEENNTFFEKIEQTKYNDLLGYIFELDEDEQNFKDYIVSSDCVMNFEFLIDCFLLNLEPLEKIKLLNERKNTILFNLVYLENFETYKTINNNGIKKIPKKSKEDENGIPYPLDEDFYKSIFNQNFVNDRLCYLKMIEVIDNEIAEILLSSNSKVVSNNESNILIGKNTKNTKYKREQMGVFIALMQHQNIITDNKSKATSFLNFVTGFSANKQAREIPNKIEYLDHLDPNMLDEIRKDLNKMIKNLDIIDGQNKRG